MFTKIKIYDCDGVLLDSTGRYKLGMNGKIDLRHWIANEHRHTEDTPLKMAESYKKDLQCHKTFVIIATARDMTLHGQVEHINRLLGTPNALVSRQGRQDRRGGVQMKVEGILSVLNEHGLNSVKERHVFEDNRLYLHGICDAIGAIPHFIASEQGE